MSFADVQNNTTITLTCAVERALGNLMTQGDCKCSVFFFSWLA
jgi:hypothetical protein